MVKRRKGSTEIWNLNSWQNTVLNETNKAFTSSLFQLSIHYWGRLLLSVVKYSNWRHYWLYKSIYLTVTLHVYTTTHDLSVSNAFTKKTSPLWTRRASQRTGSSSHWRPADVAISSTSLNNKNLEYRAVIIKIISVKCWQRMSLIVKSVKQNFTSSKVFTCKRKLQVLVRSERKTQKGE